MADQAHRHEPYQVQPLISGINQSARYDSVFCANTGCVLHGWGCVEIVGDPGAANALAWIVLFFMTPERPGRNHYFFAASRSFES